mmetsp:Transcript_28047/g.77174  ORF Transcript_28047/g.77174 Transcript_28047/m.77174 type:complete len:202 (-) Transcript_28047:882-1487(-)
MWINGLRMLLPAGAAAAPSPLSPASAAAAPALPSAAACVGAAWWSFWHYIHSCCTKRQLTPDWILWQGRQQHPPSPPAWGWGPMPGLSSESQVTRTTTRGLSLPLSRCTRPACNTAANMVLQGALTSTSTSPARPPARRCGCTAVAGSCPTCSWAAALLRYWAQQASARWHRRARSKAARSISCFVDISLPAKRWSGVCAP